MKICLQKLKKRTDLILFFKYALWLVNCYVRRMLYFCFCFFNRMIMDYLNLEIRIDKWLWMVRIFKTRSLATEACNAGKVKMNGNNVKPSKDVKTNEIYNIKIGQLDKTVQVIGTPKNRVGAQLVPQYYTDLTPQEEYDRVKMLNTSFERREHGVGRPTKRDRRQIEYLKEMYK